METDTLAVLALDAADYQLARKWECENLLLDRYGPLETYAHTHDVPFTPEVWTTVATGDHPDNHGVQDVIAGWDNPVLAAASWVTQHLPNRYRHMLGKPFRARGYEQSHTTTNLSHAFEDGVLYSWPGIVKSENFEAAWKLIEEMEKGQISDGEFRRQISAATGEEFAWLSTAVDTSIPIAGVHSHVLDAAGHVYAERPELLREIYERVDQRVAELRQRADRLVILSDHGMQTSVCDDPDIGMHSWRAYIAAQGISGQLPESVYDCAKWFDEHAGDARKPTDKGHVDAPTDHLQDLGYL